MTFAFFPVGLVLYWVTNSLISIAQQRTINRRIEAAVKRGRERWGEGGFVAIFIVDRRLACIKSLLLRTQ